MFTVSPDDLGFSVTKDSVHVHDLQATWMHLIAVFEKIEIQFSITNN